MHQILIECQDCHNKYKIHENDLLGKNIFKCTECGNSWKIEQNLYKMNASKDITRDALLTFEKSLESKQNNPTNTKIKQSSSIKNEETSLVSKSSHKLQASNNKSLSSKTFSFLLIVSIAGNIIFWTLYFLTFYFDIKFLKTLFCL